MTDTLLTDWLEAIALTRGPIAGDQIVDLVTRVAVRWASPTECNLHISSITYRQAIGFTGQPRTAVVIINPRLARLPKVERIEMLMYVVVRIHQYFSYHNDLESLPIYDALGVVPNSLFNPLQRWLRLGQKYHQGRVAASVYEDRSICPVCKIHVATGHVNPLIHDGCRDYVRNVYAPALRAQQEAEKQEASRG